MSYGLVLCGLCRRPRIVSTGDSVTTCPYCGFSERAGKAGFIFESDDQAEVRAALAKAMGADELLPTREELRRKKKKIEEADPESTLAYRYEHAGDMDERMDVLASGLTSLKGEFTLEDVEEYEPRRAEKMLSAMLDRGFVHETRPGFYRARSLFENHLGMSLRFLPSIRRTSRTMFGSFLIMM